MTVVALCSAKGSPGVTTLACVLGAVWPIELPVVVAECDPAGGDIGRRFDLPGRAGMASFALAAGRGGGVPDLRPHLQHLPGGLEVLVGPASAEAARAVDAEVDGVSALLGLDSDVVIDCGRVQPDAPGQRELLARADVVVVVSGDSSAALGHASDLARRLRASRGDAVVGIAAVAGHSHRRPARSGGPVPLAGVVAHDRAAAAVVSGEPGSGRRLARSPLITSAERLRRWIGSSVADCPAPRPGPDAARPDAPGLGAPWGPPPSADRTGGAVPRAPWEMPAGTAASPRLPGARP